VPVVEFIELDPGGNIGDLGGGSCSGTLLQMRRQAADAISTILSDQVFGILTDMLRE
jgi:hypothetical protein